MQSRRSLIASFVVFIACILPVTCLVHGPITHPHWYETREHHSPTRQIPSSTPPLLIDTFQDPLHNDLGFWHGTGENLSTHHGAGYIRLFPTDPDQNFHTQFDTHGCYSLVPWKDQYLHVIFEGNEEFSVSLNEHNAECYPSRSPFPGTPDSVQASRYLMRTRTGRYRNDETGRDSKNVPNTPRKHSSPNLNGPNKDRCEIHDDDDQVPASAERTELYIPLSHFNIDLSRVVSVSFTGFYTKEPINLYRVEIVSTVPPPSTANNHFGIPEKAPSGSLILRCSLPNSFAFGIDDGQPRYAQEVLRILDEEDVRVTFFVVGAGLSDPTTNFTNFYQEMLKKGHQVALHSNTHPKMEALPTLQKIDQEIIRTIQVFKDRLNVESRYFRPPFGTVGARLRQRLAHFIRDPYIVNWSVDVEDWLWANTSTPEKQLDAFYRSVARGGNLAVMHFLNPTTVGYLPQFIRHVKAAGFRVMRIDQCLGDPHSPPL